MKMITVFYKTTYLSAKTEKLICWLLENACEHIEEVEDVCIEDDDGNEHWFEPKHHKILDEEPLTEAQIATISRQSPLNNNKNKK